MFVGNFNFFNLKCSRQLKTPSLDPKHLGLRKCMAMFCGKIRSSRSVAFYVLKQNPFMQAEETAVSQTKFALEIHEFDERSLALIID